MWILPTRSRPANLKRAMENYPDAPVCVVWTAGDPDLPEMEAMPLPKMWQVFIAEENSTVPSLLNQVFEAHPEEDYYGFIGDDVIPPKEPWWDELGDCAYPSFFAFPKDEYHGGANAPHFAVGGDLVRATGWLAAPWYDHNFIDTTWYVLAQELKARRYLPDLAFKHIHPILGGEDDKIYQRGRRHYEEDKLKFEVWNKPATVKALAEKIRRHLHAL